MRLCDLFPNHAFDDVTGAQIVTTISADSRRITQGSVFVALTGHDADGHDYCEDAIAAGAIALVTEKEVKTSASCPVIITSDSRESYSTLCARFWPKRPAIIAAVTGTNGKTSVAEFLRQIWFHATWRSASLGTLGVHVSGADITYDAPSLTSYASEDLFNALHQLASAGVGRVVLEASSHGLAQGRLAAMPLHVAGFTNLSRDHLDFHGDMTSYFDAKASLFHDYLPEGAAAAIAIHDEAGQKLARALEARAIIVKTVGYQDSADLQIHAITSTSYGHDCQISFHGERYHIALALKGRFQVENALLAALMAHLSGLPPQDSFGALARLKPIAGRMQPVAGHPKGAEILVDYAHTPDALENALRHLRPDVSGRLIVLFGCGGDRDKGKRALMGHVASEFADKSYITDDNPRSEDPAAIRAEIMAASHSHVVEVADRKTAIEQAIQELDAGDCLLIAGKGHETTQLVGHETLPFDDVAIANVAVSFLSQGGADA